MAWESDVSIDSSSAPQTGTTIVAVEYKDGVVLGADSRVSTGTYVSNRASDKITALADAIYLLRSGSAADTQAVSDYGRFRVCSWDAFHARPYRDLKGFSMPHLLSFISSVRYFTEQHEMQLQKNARVSSVANLVKLVSRCLVLVSAPQQMNYQNKHLIGAMIVAGWDEVDGGQVYGVPIGGTLSREEWAIDGSGSTFLWGYLESEFRKGMAANEAEDLVTAALALAMSRDGSSGGVIRLITIDAHGARRKVVTPEEHPVFWDEIPAPVGMTV